MSATFEKIQDLQGNLASIGTCYTTIDMHTCGEPLRVVMGGVPDLAGQTILEKRRSLKEHRDGIRKLLMYEPRGHRDMYGCLLVEPERPDSDFGIIFMHNEGYSTMCGHAIIAVTRLAALLTWKDPQNGIVTLKIDAPCGQIFSQVNLSAADGYPVQFEGVPSFVYRADLNIDMPIYGPINYDLAYGGAFYAYVDADAIGLDLSPANITELMHLGRNLKSAIQQAGITVNHPLETDLSFLYGVIFRSKALAVESDYLNVCVFADGEIDRSPTGSGLCGTLALLRHKQLIFNSKELIIESIIRTKFKGYIKRETNFAHYQAVIPIVSGDAYITGKHHFYLDPSDPLQEGFLLR